MAKRKTAKGKTPEKSSDEMLQDLVELAVDLGLSTDALSNELDDACQSDAALAHEQIVRETLRNQLEFLYVRNYPITRLEELIRDLSKTDTES